MDVHKFAGKWTLIESDNFDEYLKAIGTTWIIRKIAAKIKPVMEVEISNNGQHWKVMAITPLRNHLTQFDLDVEFEEETIDNRKMKSLFSMDGEKLLQHQRKIKPDDKDSYFERYINDDGTILTVVSQSGNVRCVRKFRKFE